MENYNLCSWSLDLSINGRISIRSIRLITNKKVNIIAGKNGCGKSQMLSIIHSYRNTKDDAYLQDQGYKTYFLKEDSKVIINGPSRFFYIHPTRAIGKHPAERQEGPYSFEDMKHTPEYKERYIKFRLQISRLAYDAAHYSRFDNPELNQKIRKVKKDTLDLIVNSFESMFPGLSLKINVDEKEEKIFTFGHRSDMTFIRPQDPEFGGNLYIPFNSLSDGEINALFLLYEVIFRGMSNRSNMLYLIDEIENHLHPSLQEKLIKTLLKYIPNNVMLLATTHSPVIIASVPRESRFLLVHSSEKDSKDKLYYNQLISASSDVYSAKIMYELYGAESQLMAAFLLGDVEKTLKAAWLKFAAESFLPPPIVDRASPTDPQRVSISSLLQLAERPTNILDIGAGEGRLIKSIRKDYARSAIAPDFRFDLVEPNPGYRLELAKLKDGKVFVAKIINIFSGLSDIKLKNYYHFIFLHNVLHEMDPNDIIMLFEMVPKILKENGCISIMEQLMLPAGEPGFCVMTLESIQMFLDLLGYEVLACDRKSFSGIPIYELTARPGKDSGTNACPPVMIALEKAIELTLSSNIKMYGKRQKLDHPMLRAFLAFNISNAHQWLDRLKGR